MRDDERRWPFGDDPEEEPEDFFEEDDNPPEEPIRKGEEPEEHEIEARLRRLFGEPEEPTERAPRFDKGRELEVRVMGVYERVEYGQPRALLVQLRDNYGRVVPIVIGPCEAHAIASALNEEIPQRPMTHDLMRNILTRLGVTVDRVLIDDLWQGTFYAKIYLIHGDKEYEIDSRPSDAIALALRFRAPIYMAESVLEMEGHSEE